MVMRHYKLRRLRVHAGRVVDGTVGKCDDRDPGVDDTQHERHRRRDLGARDSIKTLDEEERAARNLPALGEPHEYGKRPIGGVSTLEGAHPKIGEILDERRAVRLAPRLRCRRLASNGIPARLRY
jgi:hypothetical protein